MAERGGEGWMEGARGGGEWTGWGRGERSEMTDWRRGAGWEGKGGEGRMLRKMSKG